MNENWLTIKEINKKLGKPRADSTIHRWSNDFEEFLRAEEVGGKKIKHFPPEDIEVFKYIIKLANKGHGVEHIKQKLREEFPVTIDIHEDNSNNKTSNFPIRHQQNQNNIIELKQALARYEESNEMRWNKFFEYYEKLHEKMDSLQKDNKKLQEDNETMRSMLEKQQQANKQQYQELKKNQEKSIEEINKNRKEFYDSLEIISTAEVETAVAKVWQRERERDKQEDNKKKIPLYKRLLGKK